MAANFASASSQRLVNGTPPITGYPFSVGVWLYPTTIAAGLATAWSINDNATEDNHLYLRRSAAVLTFGAIAGATAANANLTAFFVANAWHFVVIRGISATNRRISGILANGSTLHAQNTTSRTPAGLDNMAFGASEVLTPINFWDGLIGEWWITNTDIQADAAQLQDDFLRQLAYGGPFSVPHIAKDIIEYRSFRKHPTSDGDEIGEVYHGAAGSQVWSNTNGVTIGHHPPLPYWHEKQGQNRRILTI